MRWEGPNGTVLHITLHTSGIYYQAGWLVAFACKHALTLIGCRTPITLGGRNPACDQGAGLLCFRYLYLTPPRLCSPTDERDPLEIKLVRTAVVPWPGPTWSWAGSPLTRYMHHHDLYQKVQQGQREPPTGPYVRGQLWFPDTAARVLYDSATGELLVPCGDGSFLQILEVSITENYEHILQ